MIVRTLPREIAARWIRAGDEIAMYDEIYEVENGSGEADSGKRSFCRTEEFVKEHEAVIDWWLVIEGADLLDKDSLPGGIDYVGAQAFVMVPVVDSQVGKPRAYAANDHEQFVIRERVRVSAEGQRDSAGTTAAEHAASLAAHTVLFHKSARNARRDILERTAQLPVSRIPVGVAGQAIGRPMPESSIDFYSERDSDETIRRPDWTAEVFGK